MFGRLVKARTKADTVLISPSRASSCDHLELDRSVRGCVEAPVLTVLRLRDPDDETKPNTMCKVQIEEVNLISNGKFDSFRRQICLVRLAIHLAA